MKLTYSQSTGQLRTETELIGLCYAGAMPYVNNPAFQTLKSKGPLPVGEYTLGPKETNTRLGPVVFKLIPSPHNKMFGRSAFYIHWDNSKRDLSASEGCIVPMTPGTFAKLTPGDILTVTP